MAYSAFLRRPGRFLALLLLAATIACSPIDRLKRAHDADSGGFSADLAAEYLAFAESEKELGHKDNSTYFARKGLRAVRGKPVGPEDPAQWDIDDDTRLELNHARKRLMRAHNDFLARVASQRVARAQMLYDCWVMQAAERSDDDLALPCRGEFLGEVAQLEQIVATLGPAPKVSLPAHYTILFPLGSATLGKNAAFTVQEVLAITRLFPLHTIEVTGHTDRSGSRERNLVLSTERAANVAQALVDAGIPPEVIGFSAEGEDNPVVPTLDGVRRERNRRVEISVLPLMPAPLQIEAPESQDGL